MDTVKTSNTSTTTHQNVMTFLNHFTNNGTRKEVIETFTSGCCYWFAVILSERFSCLDATIVYDPVANHWACEIDGHIYDITGDVCRKYNFEDWYDFVVDANDDAYINRLYRDCISFAEPS